MASGCTATPQDLTSDRERRTAARGCRGIDLSWLSIDGIDVAVVHGDELRIRRTGEAVACRGRCICLHSLTVGDSTVSDEVNAATLSTLREKLRAVTNEYLAADDAARSCAHVRPVGSPDAVRRRCRMDVGRRWDAVLHGPLQRAPRRASSTMVG